MITATVNLVISAPVIEAQLKRIGDLMEDGITALADLRAAVTGLNTSFAAELSAIAAALAAKATPTGVAPADVETTVADLLSLKTKIDAETAALAPPPVPPVTPVTP